MKNALLSLNIDSETHMAKPASPLAIREDDHVQMTLLQLSMLLRWETKPDTEHH